MDGEYRRYLLVKSILDAYPRSYEYRNIVERWILSMANIKMVARNDPVFVDIGVEHPINVQMRKELVDKRIFKEEGALIFVGNLLELVKDHLAMKIEEDKILRIDGGTVLYRDFCFTIPKKRMKLLLEIAKYNGAPDPEEAVGKMIMRYASLGMGSQQWTIPMKTYRNLYENYGVRIEGFASPINSQLLAIDYKTTKICTLFPDTDHWFNSIGNFFDTSFENCIMVVNPPFIENILTKTAKKLIELKNNNVTSFFIMPEWLDCEAYNMLIHATHRVHLSKGDYRYYNSISGRAINAKFNSIMAVFGDNCNYDDITKDFIYSSSSC